MKKILLFLGILFIGLLTTGCFNNKASKGKIYTTVYPITFITNYLYDRDDINSIYPLDADTENYRLTKKQIKEYANSEIFIYNGLTNEQEIAKDFINYNKRLVIIDASNGINYQHTLEEIWLSPNNFLMLAKNIKQYLIKNTENQETIRTIESNYKKLEDEISIMDAELRSISKEAKENSKSQTLVVSSNKFKYLENYGFEIVSLDETENISENNLNNIKNNFKNEKYKYILMPKGEENSELINNLINEYKAEITYVNIMHTLSKDDESKNENYLTLMNTYIDNIRSIILK
ncbi:MAG: zinc ABC transporter substrate-binding protein [Bacilli bacterium]|nr:zinc ABC transporter substrate-binding protein [Bacilli bacterium]